MKSLFLPLAACCFFISACSESEPEDEPVSVTIHKISESDPGCSMCRPLVDDSACRNVDSNYIVINVHTPESLFDNSSFAVRHRVAYGNMCELYKIENVENMHYGRKGDNGEWCAYRDGELESLKDDIKRDLEANPGAKLLVRTDVNTRFERVYALLKIANELGMSQIDFSVLPLVNGTWTESHVEKVLNYEIPSMLAVDSPKPFGLNITEDSTVQLHHRGRLFIIANSLENIDYIYSNAQSYQEHDMLPNIQHWTSSHEGALSELSIVLGINPKAHMQRVIDVLSALQRVGVKSVCIKAVNDNESFEPETMSEYQALTYESAAESENPIEAYCDLYRDNLGCVSVSAPACKKMMELLWERDGGAYMNNGDGSYSHGDRWTAWKRGKMYCDMLESIYVQMEPSDQILYDAVKELVDAYEKDPKVQAENRRESADRAESAW